MELLLDCLLRAFHQFDLLRVEQEERTVETIEQNLRGIITQR